MDYEKKLALAKEALDSGSYDKETIEYIFPELKESEDERMVKFIKKQLFNIKKTITENYELDAKLTKAIDWLEKQGEQKSIDDLTQQEAMDIAVAKCFEQGEQKLYVNDNAKEMFIKALERVEEQNNKGYKLTDCDKNSWWEDFKAYCGFSEIQKPTDKVEPKFYKGDWIIHQGTENIYQVVAVIDNQYQLKYGDNYTVQNCADVDRCARLWDIAKDAKAGDVLACESGWTCIFKTLVNDETFSSYCFMDNTKWFCETGSEGHTLNERFAKAYNGEISPATKEQRDTLEKAMADAGYTFDFEKKELKKIEQKPAWSEEDERLVKNLISTLSNLYARNLIEKETKEKYTNLLKSIKERVQPQNHWKPSDEQMIELRRVISGCSYDIEPLVEIEEHLKKLKG